MQNTICTLKFCIDCPSVLSLLVPETLLCSRLCHIAQTRSRPENISVSEKGGVLEVVRGDRILGGVRVCGIDFNCVDMGTRQGCVSSASQSQSICFHSETSCLH